MENCIFCKIVNGQIPSYKIYEDEHGESYSITKENFYELRKNNIRTIGQNTNLRRTGWHFDETTGVELAYERAEAKVIKYKKELVG